MATRIFYLDDSGTVDTGFIVYGWLEIDIVCWSKALRCWLDFRKKLYRDTGIPPEIVKDCIASNRASVRGLLPLPGVMSPELTELSRSLQ